jgi:hypothetical protein
MHSLKTYESTPRCALYKSLRVRQDALSFSNNIRCNYMPAGVGGGSVWCPSRPSEEGGGRGLGLGRGGGWA